jgi:DNA-directed RNA polymerase subunit RPC12/RpoP
MKIELRTVAGEEVPALVFKCEHCSHEYALKMEEVMTTRPYRCAGCDVSRFITYREYLAVHEKFAAVLLDFTIARITGNRSQ